MTEFTYCKIVHCSFLVAFILKFYDYDRDQNIPKLFYILDCLVVLLRS